MVKSKETNTDMSGLSFLWKRTLGIFSRQRKAGAAARCLLPIVFVVLYLSVFGTEVVFASAPQVIITDTKKSDVMSVIVPEMLSAGMTVKNMNDYSVTFSMYKDNFWASVFSGSNSFEMRLTYNIVEIGNDTMITANGQVVSFPGTAREVIYPADRKIEEQIQDVLNRLKFGFDGGYKYGFEYKRNKSEWQITSVTPDCSFAKAGIVSGDKLIGLNGKPLGDIENNELERIFAEPSAYFTIKHSDGRTKTYPLSKSYIAPRFKKSLRSTPLVQST